MLISNCIYPIAGYSKVLYSGTLHRKEEARHIALMELNEANVPYVYSPVEQKTSTKSNGNGKRKEVIEIGEYYD